ncbi:hypothetical protein HMPREF9371_0425 [Neisseria shayeganii 871]|uniref:Uncharacterized protein n=1 Tax=Neisseria shayeganii 871 TaxID=1032488 RepID=G4CFQ0_9NEIS|nr:hypothetical protein HMPREF9371_0425 [Neisseria shayeganii 871]
MSFQKLFLKIEVFGKEELSAVPLWERINIAMKNYGLTCKFHIIETARIIFFKKIRYLQYKLDTLLFYLRIIYDHRYRSEKIKSI